MQVVLDTKRVACGVLLLAAASAHAQLQPITFAPVIPSLDPNGRQRAEFARGTSQAGHAIATFWDQWNVDLMWPYITHPVRWNADGSFLEFGNLAGTDGQPIGGNIVGVSLAGVAIGASGTPSNYGRDFFPTRWDTATGQVSLMQMPSDYPRGYVHAINESGLSVGTVNNRTNSRAVAWGPDGELLGVLFLRAAGTPVHSSQAIDINASGQIVGQIHMDNGDDRFARWNSYTSQPVFFDGFDHVISMNDRGTVFGGIVDRVQPAARYGRLPMGATTPQALLGLPSAANPSVPEEVWVREMNNDDTVIGISIIGRGGWGINMRAVKWEAGQSQAALLETDSLEFYVPGFLSERKEVSHSDPNGINDHGVIVGSAHSSFSRMAGDEWIGGWGEQFAVAWTPEGHPIDLNTLIDSSSGWRLWEAMDISNDNWITGYAAFYPHGVESGESPTLFRPFLMQLPEPTSPVLLTTILLHPRRRTHRYA